MPPRVTGAEVKEILDTTIQDQKLSPFITAANQLVTEVLGDDTTLNDAQKKEIERWLAAHFVAMGPDPQPEEEGVAGGQARIKYQGKSGEGLKATRYGQTACTLDTTGKLASEGNKKEVYMYAATSFE